MRFLNLLFIGLLSTIPTVAQSATAAPQNVPVISQPSAFPTEAPGISITRVSCRKDIYIPALYEDPMAANQEQADLLREQKAIRRANAIRVQGGESPLPMPTREIYSSRKEPTPGPAVNYLYEARIKNAGEKSIKSIVWEYLVYDPETEVQIGRHSFADSSKIRPGKTATLVGHATTPPTSILQAQKAGKDSPKYTERVVINRIEYDDSSFWQRPLN